MDDTTRTLGTLLDHGLAPTRRGKVREMLDIGSYFVMVATDRISAFDAVLPTLIPEKGRILTSVSAYWFRGLSRVLPTHFVSVDPVDFPEPLAPYAELLRGRWMLVRKARPIPVECIVRGYLAGSGWREYQRTGRISGVGLRPGYRLYDRLDEPIFTPTTKSQEGHDESITFEELCQRIGTDLARRLRDLSLGIYRQAAAVAEARGLVLADTKFEFGWIDGELCLIDEALTPDSSRYWPRESLEAGGEPKSLDKEFVRSWLRRLPWDGTPPAPELPDEIVAETRKRYAEVAERLGAERETPEIRPLKEE
jgi:phosphoribosylaminoimidazole-succinocarboxamide synthase